MTPDLQLQANLARLIAHTIVFEAGRPLRDDGVDPATIRCDFSPSPPPPRNLAQEGRETAAVQRELAPQQYADTATYSPLYTDLQVSNVRGALLGRNGQPGLVQTLAEVAPQLQATTTATTTAQREADIRDLELNGGRAVAAVRGADPRQEALVSRLNETATAGLDAGSSLTPAQAAEIAQRVRGSQASRGVGFGSPDAITEAFAQGERGLALERDRRTFASGVVGINAATGADPALTLLGRPSSATGGASSLLGQGGAAVGANGAPDFNPFTSYASDLFNTNYNAEAASNIAGANNDAAVYGGLMSSC